MKNLIILLMLMFTFVISNAQEPGIEITATLTHPTGNDYPDTPGSIEIDVQGYAFPNDNTFPLFNDYNGVVYNTIAPESGYRQFPLLQDTMLYTFGNNIGTSNFQDTILNIKSSDIRIIVNSTFNENGILVVTIPHLIKGGIPFTLTLYPDDSGNFYYNGISHIEDYELHIETPESLGTDTDIIVNYELSLTDGAVLNGDVIDIELSIFNTKIEIYETYYNYSFVWLNADDTIGMEPAFAMTEDLYDVFAGNYRFLIDESNMYYDIVIDTIFTLTVDESVNIKEIETIDYTFMNNILSFESDVEITVYTLNGSKLMQGKRILDLNHLVNGVYLINCIKDDEVHTFKVLKK